MLFLSLSLSFVVKFSGISCLGKLSYEIGVCIRVYHSFVGESCIHECATVYDGILMRSLLVSSLHLVFSPCNRPYMMILMGVLTIYQVCI